MLPMPIASLFSLDLPVDIGKRGPIGRSTIEVFVLTRAKKKKRDGDSQKDSDEVS